MNYSRYVAIGDSISIDLYPALDAAEGGGAQQRGLGAASLFFRNDDEGWPEFRGRDLESLLPAIGFRNTHGLRPRDGV